VCPQRELGAHRNLQSRNAIRQQPFELGCSSPNRTIMEHRIGQMRSSDVQQGDHYMDVLQSNYDKMPKNASMGRNTVSSTSRDVARLAGVSIATVSRVMNGASNVSGETRTKVLAAISQLQYCPNTHATELRRGKRRNPLTRGNHMQPLAAAKTRTSSPSKQTPWGRDRQKTRSRLLASDDLEVGRVIARLTEDLEKLRSILQLR